MIILLTDGNQTTTAGPFTPLDEAIQPLKNKNIRVVTVGIGDIDQKQMETISPNERDRYNPKSFEKLEPLVDEIFSRIPCPGKRSQWSFKPF